MCMSTPKIDVPKAPQIEKTIEERKARVRGEEDQRRRAAMSGIRSTILTGPAAAQNTGKTLLGQ